MSELHKFVFDGLPVRGQWVRIDDAWQEILRRRAANNQLNAYPEPVAHMLGEMVAAATLMQSSIQFDGALILQIAGDGPVKLAVAEVQSDLALRATASLTTPVDSQAMFATLVNATGEGRCAITLDPKGRRASQQAYQGVVALVGDDGQPLGGVAAIIEQYMRHSEQLDAVLVLAADATTAAGLMLQRMPVEGEHNLPQNPSSAEPGGAEDDFQRLAVLARSLKTDELLTLDADTILRRLFWGEQLLRFQPAVGKAGPRFSCSCSRQRVAAMLKGLGKAEVDSILAERGDVEVGCDFCGQQEHFDTVDVARLFTDQLRKPPRPDSIQ